MFARIMAVVIACIVLLTLSFGALSAVTVRNQQINARLEALTKEAREIAFLAANNQTSSMALMFGYDDDMARGRVLQASFDHQSPERCGFSAAACSQQKTD